MSNIGLIQKWDSMDDILKWWIIGFISGLGCGMTTTVSLLRMFS